MTVIIRGFLKCERPADENEATHTHTHLRQVGSRDSSGDSSDDR